VPWPDLPDEGIYGEIENSFIENSPPDLWPDNQDSNFGQIRKVVTDVLQECADFISILYLEMFVATSTRYLGLWEELAGLPVEPAGLTVEERRTSVAAILQKGPFTRTRRNTIVESFLQAGVGSPAMFTPEGISFDDDDSGIALFGEGDPLAPLYNVVEDIGDFSYSVRIKNGTPVDDAALGRALTIAQPAGLSFTIDFVASP
jgi:hypothetical protein